MTRIKLDSALAYFRQLVSIALYFPIWGFL